MINDFVSGCISKFCNNGKMNGEFLIKYNSKKQYRLIKYAVTKTILK